MRKKFKDNLLKELTKLIRGNIKLHYYNDILLVEISASTHETFRYNIKNIDERLYKGYTSKDATNEIYLSYKKYILSRYFK